MTAADDVLTALAAADDAQRQDLAALLAATAGGGLADRPRIAVTDAVSGALLALTDLPGLRRAGTRPDPHPGPRRHPHRHHTVGPHRHDRTTPVLRSPGRLTGRVRNRTAADRRTRLVR